MEILKNTWVVGISTGIISGILVFFLTKWLMDKKGKVEYFKQVDIANRNVISSMKPYIADKGLPDIGIFEALISSTARTLNVDEKDMFTVGVYCEELIREIISDVYVSNDKKEEYTTMLAEYKNNIEKKVIICEPNKVNYQTGKYAEKMRRQMSMYLAVLASVLGMLSSFYIIYGKDNMESNLWYYSLNNNSILLTPFMIVLVVLLMAMISMVSELLIKTLRRHREEIQRGSGGKKSKCENK